MLIFSLATSGAVVALDKLGLDAARLEVVLDKIQLDQALLHYARFGRRSGADQDRERGGSVTELRHVSPRCGEKFLSEELRD